jgi:hypothetical protein
MAVRRDGEIRSRLRSRLLRLVTRDEGAGPMGHSATSASDGLPASHGPLLGPCLCGISGPDPASLPVSAANLKPPGRQLRDFHWHLQVGEAPYLPWSQCELRLAMCSLRPAAWPVCGSSQPRRPPGYRARIMRRMATWRAAALPAPWLPLRGLPLSARASWPPGL